MKILVFDDSLNNHITAEKLLSADHELTIVGTYDEAQQALTGKTDHKKAREIYLPKLLLEAGLPSGFSPWRPRDMAEEDWIEPSEERKAIYHDCWDKSIEMATIYPDFDVVLTDLMVPASRQAQGPDGERFVGQEMPLGTTIALLALTIGIKNVAVVTDMNHHNHPASAAFDCFADKCEIEGVNILCTNRAGTVWISKETGELVDLDPNPFSDRAKEEEEMYPWNEDYTARAGLNKGKDWRKILNRLIPENSTTTEK